MWLVCEGFPCQGRLLLQAAPTATSTDASCDQTCLAVWTEVVFAYIWTHHIFRSSGGMSSSPHSSLPHALERNEHSECQSCSALDVCFRVPGGAFSPCRLQRSINDPFSWRLLHHGWLKQSHETSSPALLATPMISTPYYPSTRPTSTHQHGSPCLSTGCFHCIHKESALTFLPSERHLWMMAVWPQAPALEKDSPFKEKGKALCAQICACFVMGHITMNPKEEGKRGGSFCLSGGNSI